jgi:Zn finger protein HypA/HybF involved in hydrogenase expression
MSQAPTSQTQYPCSNCGANVEFAPGTTVLKCPYCGAETPLAPTGRQIREHLYAEFAGLPRKPIAALAPHVFTCRGCGAVTQSDKLSDRCQFCDAPLVADVGSGEQVTPEGVLPFGLDRPALREALRKWASSRWFAPNGLKKVTEAESSHSTYLPHWTYDARTESRYQGQRGEHYWETETYTENGETKTRQVRRTAWYPAGGTVARDFDDIVVAGTTHVTPKHLDALEPWPLPEAQPYRPEYLAGHETLRYDVEPESGLGTAKSRMAPIIEKDCKQDIGGDEQRVQSVDTDYRDVTFKLMLLPVWIACYLHAGRTYNILVNGRTGEVAGERPYSVAKIVTAIVVALVVIAAIVTLIVLNRNG